MMTGVGVIRSEMREGDEQTRVEMRVLHEEVIDRLKVIHEAQLPRPTATGRSPRRSKP